MKTKLLFVVLLLVLFSCGKKKEQIEIIPNYDEIYSAAYDVDVKPATTNISEEASEKIIKRIGETKGTIGVFTLFINERGKVDKIKEESIVNRNGETVVKKNSAEVLNILLNEIEKWKFDAAEKDGKPVKSKLVLELIRIPNDASLKINFRNPFSKQGVQIDKTTYFVVAEEMPEPIGGVKAVQEKVVYPDLARRAGIQGRVFVKTFVDEEGNVTKTEIIKGIGGGCDEAARKAVEETKFIPAKQKGKPVKVQVVMPILFQLNANVDFILEKEEKGSSPDYAEIKGAVTETENKTPVAAASVSLVGSSIGAATDEEGAFVITKIPPGKYILNFNHPKYGGKKSKEFEFKKGKRYIFKINVAE